MTPQEFDQFLAASFEDHRLSRAEKREFKDALAQLDLDGDDYAHLRNRAFRFARDHEAEPVLLLNWLEDVVRTLVPRPDAVTNEALFSPGETCWRRIVGLLTAAKRTVDICVFTITDDRITEAVVNAHRRGIKVRLVTDNLKAEDRGSDIDRIESNGIPVAVDRSHRHMHHKFAVFDERRLLTGSYNWTRGAADHNQENVVISDDPTLVAPFLAEFEGLWERFAS